MPVSLPEGEVGVSASFRKIFLPFEAIRGEYLSRTQWLRKGGHLVHFAPGTNWSRGLKRTIDIIYIDAPAVLLVHVGLAQARPNNTK